MSIKKILAIFQKTTKDALSNKRLILVFLIFPIMTLIFYNMMPESKDFFSTIFIPMHLILVPASTMAGIISEEKEKNTLKSLILANVKPLEYFIGVGLLVLLSTIICTSLFLFVMNLSGIEYLRFYIIIILSSLCSMIIGSMIGIYSQNQMNANAMISPVAIIFGILPMFASFNETIKNVASIIYTQTLSNVLVELNKSISIKDYLIIAINFIVFIIIFSLIYKKRRLDA